MGKWIKEINKEINVVFAQDTASAVKHSCCSQPDPDTAKSKKALHIVTIPFRSILSGFRIICWHSCLKSVACNSCYYLSKDIASFVYDIRSKDSAHANDDL